MRFKRRFAHPDRAECAVKAQADKLIMQKSATVSKGRVPTAVIRI